MWQAKLPLIKKEEEKFLVIIKVFLLILQRDRNRRVQKRPHKN
jgi:hypothetical protein